MHIRKRHAYVPIYAITRKYLFVMKRFKQINPYYYYIFIIITLVEWLVSAVYMSFYYRHQRHQWGDIRCWRKYGLITVWWVVQKITLPSYWLLPYSSLVYIPCQYICVFHMTCYGIFSAAFSLAGDRQHISQSQIQAIVTSRSVRQAFDA